MSTKMHPWAHELASFDTETTGVNVREARIVSASIVILDIEGNVHERYDWLFNPNIEIPFAATQVHGVTTKMAKEQGIDSQVGIKQLVTKLDEFTRAGLPLVVFNAPYDLSLLNHEIIRNNISPLAPLSPVLDPLIIDRQFDRFRRGKRTLSALCEHHKIQLSSAHDAAADATAAAQLMQELSRKHKEHLPENVMDLHDQQVLWSMEQAKSFEEFMRKTKDPHFKADGAWPYKYV